VAQQKKIEELKDNRDEQGIIKEEHSGISRIKKSIEEQVSEIF